MRKIQNIISIFMLGTFLGVLLVILSMNAACSPLKYEDFESGDFKYRLYKETPTNVDVVAFSQNCLDTEEKTAIIPPYVNGKIVNGLGVQIYIGTSHLYSPTVESLYIPYTINHTTKDLMNTDSLKKMVISSNQLINYMLEDNNEFSVCATENTKYYISSFAYEDENVKKLITGQWAQYDIIPANTSFMFNFENSPNNDYFFIDNFNYGAKINDTPYTPTRDGYTFGGWYKEPACISVWDFHIDKLPMEHSDEESNVVYQETKLYAKWIKN